MYYAKVEAKNEKCTLAIKDTIPIEIIEEEYQYMVVQPLNNAISGWFNSYVCI